MSNAAPAAPRRLRCEYLVNPLGVGEPRPRLSWQVNDERRGAVQTAYQVLVASNSPRLEAGEVDVWDSGKVASDRNANIEYGGPPAPFPATVLLDRTHVGRRGPALPLGSPGWWEMALLEAADWRADWIGIPAKSEPTPPAYLRRGFAVDKPVLRARAYVTALGVCELYLNGERVGDDVLAPGWTDYRRRVMYRVHDVTGALLRGENALAAVVAEGWYCGQLGWDREPYRNHFGQPPVKLLMQLEIEYEDGEWGRIVTDGSWNCSAGPIVSSAFYGGETYDARLEMPGWDRPGFDEAGWQPATVFHDHGAVRCAQMDPPIRITEELSPVSVTEFAPGVFIFDMGQNMVGRCRLHVSGPAGTRVTLRHAEVLNPDGSLYTENLRSAYATDVDILRGEGDGTCEPRFTYHGFRYVEVTGYPGTPGPEALTGLVFHTDCERSGTLETSSELVNRLYSNIVWGQRGNMHSVLTDCPQRDERLGWLGDAQIFARTACFNMDMAAMLTKFARDMTDAQKPNGAFTDTCPWVNPGLHLPPVGAPAWMDAGVIVPWTVYLCYGDTRILERHFDSMVRYVEYVAANNPDGIWERARGFDYGDWVPAGGETDKTMFATLHYFYSAVLTAAAAQVLGREDEADRCAAVAARVRDAFNERYLADGRYPDASQTINALALSFGICPEEARRRVAEDLVADIEARGGHLSTGFSGTQWLLPALCDEGHDEVARRILLQRDYPSWGHMIEKGATTIWELWNADTEGPGMNSRNHFADGSVGEWLFRYLAGIDTTVEGAGYRRIVIRPHPGPVGGELTEVRASYESLQGLITSEWKVTDAGFELNMRVPANSCAIVYLPGRCASQVTESGVPLEQAEGIQAFREEHGRVVCEVGAGQYRFKADTDAQG